MHGKSLFEVYKKPSKEKIVIWSGIYDDYVKYNGYDIDVCGNTWTFSVSYKYNDKDNHVHEVYITPSNKKDVIKWAHKDIKAVYAMSAFNGYGILDIKYGIDDKCISCYIYDGKISDVKETKIHYTILGRAYIIRNKYKLYIDEFLKI